MRVTERGGVGSVGMIGCGVSRVRALGFQRPVLLAFILHRFDWGLLVGGRGGRSGLVIYSAYLNMLDFASTRRFCYGAFSSFGGRNACPAYKVLV